MLVSNTIRTSHLPAPDEYDINSIQTVTQETPRYLDNYNSDTLNKMTSQPISHSVTYTSSLWPIECKEAWPQHTSHITEYPSSSADASKTCTCTWPDIDSSYHSDPLGEVLAHNNKIGNNVQFIGAETPTDQHDVYYETIIGLSRVTLAELDFIVSSTLR